MAGDTAPSTDQLLRRWDGRHWADWVVPAIVASLWALLLAAAADAGLSTRRGLVFVGGPVLLLSGLHARLTGYLHAPSRQQLLVLPLAPATHFAAARARHWRGLALTLLLGSLAVVAGLGSGGAWSPATGGLVLDWAALAGVSVFVEPLIPAASSALGRRFRPDTWLSDLQRRAGGGWTLPETVVHLYAPALGIGLSAAWAMPLQLAIDLQVDGHPVPSGLWAIAVVAVAVAVAASAVAPRLYATGVFESVPFLAEATRTLAGPPIPESTPRFIARLSDPVLRLLVLSFWRETPVPMLRLLSVAAALALIAGVDTVAPPHTAVWGAAAIFWLVPATALARSAPLRARLLGTLPLPAAHREGRHHRATAMLWSPVGLGAAVLVARLGGLW